MGDENEQKPKQGEGDPPGDKPPGTPPKEGKGDEEKPPEDEIISLPKSAFTDRVRREANAEIRRQYGVENVTEVKARLDRLKELEAKEEETRKATLTEQQRLQEELGKAQAATATAQAAAEQAALDAHINRLCTEKKIANVDYATFKIAQELEKLGEDGELDEVAFLDGLLKDPTHRAALGMAEPRKVEVPGDTTGGGSGAPKAPGAGNALPIKSVSDMSADEFRQHRQAKYGY